MGKLLFCSEGSDFEKINSLVTGFSVSSSGKGEFGQNSTYQKLRLPTKNRYQSGNDFAIGVGTFIYNGKKDADALKDILQNWNDDIGIRRSIIGSYCIGIYKSGVFHYLLMKVPPTSSISILTLIRTALPRQLHYITWQKACTVRLMTSPFLRIFFCAILMEKPCVRIFAGLPANKCCTVRRTNGSCVKFPVRRIV